MSDRYVQPLRALIQAGFLLASLVAGYRFALFIDAATAGAPAAARPVWIEAFLPISGLFGSVAWLKGGGINPVHPAAVVIFLSAVAVALLMRRSFCSWICPLGTLSEWLWKLGFKRFHRNFDLPRPADRTLRAVKYLLLAFFMFSALSWPLPALQSFLHSGYHAVSDAKLLQMFRSPSAVTIVVLCLLIIASVPLRNPFCRYLCPYGALLGLAAILSPMAVTRESRRCVSCGACSQVCPARLDVMHAGRVGNPECLGCWRCVSHCRVHGALGMRLWRVGPLPGLLFALLLIILFFAGSWVGKATGNWQSAVTPAGYRELLK